MERLKNFFLAELVLLNKYPDMFEFVKMVNTEKIPILSETISERNPVKVNESFCLMKEEVSRYFEFFRKSFYKPERIN